MDLLIRRLFVLSILVFFGGAVAFFAVAINHGPSNLAAACIFVAFFGLTLIPASGTVEWFLPIGKQRGYGRVRSLLTVAVLILALGYWGYAILVELASPFGSISLAGVGAIIYSLGLSMYFFVDVTRKHKELR